MNIFDLTGVKHHPVITELTNLLCNQTQNPDRAFFHVEVAYFASKAASTMGATLLTKDRGEIPVNLYALLLAPSGYGKGHSIYIMEQEILGGFKKTFIEDTLPVIAEQSMWDLAREKAIKNQSDETEEQEKIFKEYKSLGVYPFTFDSGTVPAVKQLRQKLLISKAGSINLQIDEIGSNLLGNAELLNLFLELYDQGMVKPKLTKNTAENVRGEELEGRTPSNLLMFGTPSKLFDGGATEDNLYSFLETGYGRRCLFANGVLSNPDDQNAEDVYKRLINPANSAAIRQWAARFTALADVDLFGWKIEVPYDIGVKLMEYKLSCEAHARSLPDHDEIKKAEISHRYFRALKLAGTYAFIDQAAEVDLDEHLLPAILLVEESGESFQKILNREKPYARLAKYVASIDGEVTHVDIMESNPFYGSTGTKRNEMMNLATAWGYKNHIIIKKKYADGVEFFSGKTLQETDLKALTISWSDDYAYNYINETAAFDQLHIMTQAQNLHFLNHHLIGGDDPDKPEGHRHDKNIIQGFDMIVIDVDGGVSVDTAAALMSSYKFLLYTTKSHDDDGEHRFRMIFPINYHLELDQEEYKKFMNAFMDWLPFDSDRGANQRARKWETFSGGNYHYNNGPDTQVMDALDFIPQTARNEEHKRMRQKLTSMDKLEGWFASKISDGNRNNMMLRFAMALVDGGIGFDEVAARTIDFNKKLPEPLDENELQRTVLVSVAKKYDEQP
jgi:hypothetical protein